MIVELLAGLGRNSVPWLWVPVWGWTVVATGILAMLWAAKWLHPAFGYRLRQALLVALPASVLSRRLLERFAPESSALFGLPFLEAVGSGTWVAAVGVWGKASGTWGPTSGAWASAGASSSALPAPTASSVVQAAASPDLLLSSLGLALVLLAGIATVRLAFLLVRIFEIARLAKVLDPLVDPALRKAAHRLQSEFGVQRDVFFRVGPPGSVPMTFHWRKPVIAVPPELCDDAPRFQLAVAHELIHVRRGDYAWGIVERVVSALFAFHPVVWLLGRSLDHFREASCDSEVVGSGAGDPKAYGELLLTLSSRPVSAPLMAAGITART